MLYKKMNHQNLTTSNDDTSRTPMSVKINRSLLFTGERVIEGVTPKRIWLDHRARYEFAARWVFEKKVLDIACGSGYGTNILYNSGAKEAVGIDLSKDAIDFASASYKAVSLKFITGNIEAIAHEDDYFDIAVCFETIEHVANPERALFELKRVLKPQGLLIISSPNRKATSPGKSIDDSPDNEFHLIEYSPNEFICLLRQLFTVQEVCGQRKINKLLFLPVLNRITRNFMPWLYSPERGNPNVEKVSKCQEYRYITAVCINTKKNA